MTTISLETRLVARARRAATLRAEPLRIWHREAAAGYQLCTEVGR